LIDGQQNTQLNKHQALLWGESWLLLWIP
jgi:hypothetical protein